MSKAKEEGIAFNLSSRQLFNFKPLYVLALKRKEIVGKMNLSFFVIG